MKVALICMPFADFTMPSLGISLLQAGLRRDGIPCDLYYLNLRFAARIGCLSYLRLGVDSPPGSLSGEWLFAAELFGADARRDRAYIETILKEKFGDYFHPRLVRRLLEVRSCVRQYLNECLERVSWARYDVVGFTSSFQQNLPSLALAKRVKEAFHGTKIIFGGANCEGEMGIELHRQFPFLDFVCSGEGDRAFPELIHRLAAGEDFGQIAGIISRAGQETLVPREIVSPIFDLDALPYPYYDDYFEQVEKVTLNRRFTPYIPYETSRGCWWGAKMHCTFCGLNGATMAYRSKSPQRALDELIYIGKQYGTKIVATDNILDLKYLDTFFPQVAVQKRRFTFHYETKVNLTRKQLRVLKDAGVRHLQPGIESLSTSILRLMKKGCNLLQNVQFLKWAKQMGIKVAWNLLHGFPGESPSEYLEMARIIPFLTHLTPPKSTERIRTDRFSPYFTRPAEYGLQEVRPQKAYSFVYPFKREALGRLAYYFEFDHPLGDSVEEYARPAVEKAKAWQSAGSRGYLKGIIRNDSLVVADTRKRGKKLTTVLLEPLRTAYIFCDQSRASSEIKAHLSACFPARAFTDAWLEEALDDLVSRGLMLKDGKSYLSLALLPLPSTLVDSRVSAGEGQEEIGVKTLVPLGSLLQLSGS
ncbi:MAG: RiPP maturation radical SAM protein 1 [Acidipila sp.]|nr:RiPP maturation radical SAM protein 1 [Acidipila sp.]